MNYAVKILYVLWRLSFVFQVEAFQFSRFHEDMVKLDKSNLRETWKWHSRSKICKIPGKSCLKFWKIIFIAGNWANCLQKFEKVLNLRKVCCNNFLTSQRLILLCYFDQKTLKEKTVILENITLFFYFLWYQDLSLYEKACLHNLCINRESLDRVSLTSTTLWVILISPIKKQQLTNWTASHLVGAIRLLFDLIYISVVNSHTIYKVLYPEGMELQDFKIILAKSWIGACNSRSWNTLVNHVSHWEVLLFSVPLHLRGLKTTRRKCRYCYTFNVILAEVFCAWFPAVDLKTVLQISIPKFNENKHFFCCYSLISSLSFTLGYVASILFIWVHDTLIKMKNFKNISKIS